MSFIERKKAGVHKQHSGLIGRHSEIASIKYAVKQMESRIQGVKVKDYPNVFYFYGPVGSGKSTILQAAYADCEKGELGFQPLSVWLDCRFLARSSQIARESMIVELAQAMVALTDELQPYLKPLFQFWDKFCKGEALPPSPLGPPPPSAPPAAAGPGAPTSVAPGSQVSRANPVRNAYGSMANLQAAGGNVQQIARNVTKNMQAAQASQRGLPSPSAMGVQTNRDICQDLLMLFAGAVDKISASVPVVLFIDHYELIAEHDGWFRGEFLKAFQRELILVIGGESNLHSVYHYDLGNVSACVRARPFNRYETELFLSSYHRQLDSKVVEAAQNLTGGLPVSMCFVASALQNMASRADTAKLLKFLAYPKEDYGDKHDRYIAYICLDEFSNSDKNLLAVLGVMRSFDPQLFSHLAEVVNVRRTLEHLSQRYPFITASGQLSDFTARILRSYFRQENEAEFEALNQDAYVYYAEQARAKPDDIALLAESMFYYFHVDDRAAYKHFSQLIGHYMDKNLDLCNEICLAALDASIPAGWRDKILKIAESLGALRKRDPKGIQQVQAALTAPESSTQDKDHYLRFLEAMS
ncbi:MAG: hypothetical protein ACAI44_16495 [Candidatus Sericytochromatia bacterium]